MSVQLTPIRGTIRSIAESNDVADGIRILLLDTRKQLIPIVHECPSTEIQEALMESLETGMAIQLSLKEPIDQTTQSFE